jgi:hypothetical protein
MPGQGKVWAFSWVDEAESTSSSFGGGRELEESSGTGAGDGAGAALLSGALATAERRCWRMVMSSYVASHSMSFARVSGRSAMVVKRAR